MNYNILNHIVISLLKPSDYHNYLPYYNYDIPNLQNRLLLKVVFVTTGLLGLHS